VQALSIEALMSLLLVCSLVTSPPSAVYLYLLIFSLSLIGLDTTSTEINVMENIFKLKDVKDANNKARNQLID
jgi:hypothetical protein